MFIPPMTLPEMIFGGFVLTCFAAFVLSLAGVHLYVTMSPGRARGREAVDRRASSPASGAGQLSSAHR
jgi:hypothetical protein